MQATLTSIETNKLKSNGESNMQSENINELATALCKCQGEMTFASKDSKNPHFNSKYADLAAVWDAIRVPLTKNGLSVVQTVQMLEGKTVMVSILMHVSGQWIKSFLPIKTDKDTCQGWGSGITYARRYALAALVGCYQDDDDGNHAEAHLKTKSSSKAKEEPKTKEPAIDAPPEEPITKKQQDQLIELAQLCEPEYLKKVYKWLETKGIDSFKDIKTKSLADNIIQGLKKNVDLRKEN